MLPSLATGARSRAKAVGQTFSGYVAILLWNYAQAPRPLEAQPGAARHAREHVPCTIRRTVWLLAQPKVRASGLSANALIEALIAEDLRAADAPLSIQPRR